MKNKLIIVATFLMATFAPCLNAQDWPQYLGPDRNSTSPETGILRSWPETGLRYYGLLNLDKDLVDRLLKMVRRIYSTEMINTGYHEMFCMETGKELWKYIYEAPGTVEFPGSRSVPTADGNYVYSCGHNGDLYCFDINTHQPVWNKNVWTDFGGQPAGESQGGFSGLEGGGRIPMWAIAQCPLIYGDLLIIASQAPEAGVVAYNKLTGDVVWKTPSLGLTGFVSPAIIKVDGKDQVVMITASSGGFGGGNQTPSNVVGIDPQNGTVLWTYSNWSCWIPSSSAFDAGENKILIVGGYRAGAAMIRIEKSGDSYSVNELFKTVEFGEHTKPPIYHNGYFYAQYTTNERRDGLVCMSKDGK
jgi:hypothetical protein